MVDHIKLKYLFCHPSVQVNIDIAHVRASTVQNILFWSTLSVVRNEDIRAIARVNYTLCSP